jgi:aminoglycoside phosphotransferase (APT) family kinase protein
MHDRLVGRIGQNAEVTHLGGTAFQVTSTGGAFALRFPQDDSECSLLDKEEQVQRGLRDWLTAIIPDTTVVDDLDGCPVFAIHSMIPGQPLTTQNYEGMSPAVRDRFLDDLATFFRETHRIPLPTACEWLGIPFDGPSTVESLAQRQGKPLWFNASAVAEMRAPLALRLNARESALFTDTVRHFEALPVDPAFMVFGHGDMHGYNMALAEDDLGLKFVGAFDLGCTGIIDIHEDFFRLSFIGEALVDRVLETYQRLSAQSRALDRRRIAIYYRAFLFYLMVDKSGERLLHLKRLLRDHLAAYGATHGQI